MIHSILVVGGTMEKRRAAAKNGQDSSELDRYIIEPEEEKRTVSIEQIRELEHRLSLKPLFGRYKAGIILEAQRMTLEAQSALLKTLEEPPANSILILTAPDVKNLLPTIVSRCQIKRLKAEIGLQTESEDYKKNAEEFVGILQMGRGERLSWAEENKTKINKPEEAVKLLNIWLSVLRDRLLAAAKKNQETNCISKSLELCFETKKLIAGTNVTARLALEVLLLDLPVITPQTTY